MAIVLKRMVHSFAEKVYWKCLFCAFSPWNFQEVDRYANEGPGRWKHGMHQANLVLTAYTGSKGSCEPAIRTVSPEPLLLAHTSSMSRRALRQKARSQAPLNGWACTVTICPDRMLEDTNSLDGARMFWTEHPYGAKRSMEYSCVKISSQI